MKRGVERDVGHLYGRVVYGGVVAVVVFGMSCYAGSCATAPEAEESASEGAEPSGPTGSGGAGEGEAEVRTAPDGEGADAREDRSGASMPAGLECLKRAYADHVKRVERTRGDSGRVEFGIEMKSSERFEWDTGEQKTFEEKLNEPDLEQMFAQPYEPGELEEPPERNWDPGRFRHAGFFRAVYGDSSEEVRENLVEVDWPGVGSAESVSFNSNNGAAEALRRVAEDLQELPEEYRKYFRKSAGTFNWRSIAGTDRLSPHSFAIAIDLNIDYANYWRWSETPDDPEYENRMPYEVVEVFERHGFVWGGKWYHYDTMHFEYRPELVGPSCGRTGGAR